MVQIARFFGIIISMYYKDHSPPHFHAQYNDFEVMIAIHDLRILQWNLPPKALALVIERASIHQKELQKNREKWLQEQSFDKIAPLQ
jgi:hypothetical protein